MVELSIDEKVRCLEEIRLRLKKVLFVYDKQAEDPNYDYKKYCENIITYVSSSNVLFKGELVNVIVNLNAIVTNDYAKPQIKRLVFESKNQIEYLLDKNKP